MQLMLAGPANTKVSKGCGNNVEALPTGCGNSLCFIDPCSTESCPDGRPPAHARLSVVSLVASSEIDRFLLFNSAMKRKVAEIG
ncbi:hypothetical protein CHS0354_030003 [Potamilus streckersoni]|uniref:Uncharacterized protein n=1 Tax=Potamilus streckersoni TaxID=2493646 RepID=A0AAE0VZ88_9BIVA|nr:hypothetical protein CHS0354_030003 [Potamilus streckersoni]